MVYKRSFLAENRNNEGNLRSGDDRRKIIFGGEER